MTDWLTLTDLAAVLGDDLAAELLRHTDHYDLDGRPVLERERVRELLDLYQYTTQEIR